MDILYYSNHCTYSKKLLLVLSRCQGLREKISFICIDKRIQDPQTNQTFILLENGSKIVKPPNLHSVPAMLLVNDNYNIIYGDDIIDKLKPFIVSTTNEAEEYNGEPRSFEFTGNNFVTSEKFTSYDLSPDELMAKGHGNRRNMQNYVSVNENITINTPDDTYKPDKIGSVTIDTIQQERNNLLEQKKNPPRLDL
jgi:hypothetical protein